MPVDEERADAPPPAPDAPSQKPAERPASTDQRQPESDRPPIPTGPAQSARRSGPSDRKPGWKPSRPGGQSGGGWKPNRPAGQSGGDEIADGSQAVPLVKAKAVGTADGYQPAPLERQRSAESRGKAESAWGPGGAVTSALESQPTGPPDTTGSGGGERGRKPKRPAGSGVAAIAVGSRVDRPGKAAAAAVTAAGNPIGPPGKAVAAASAGGNPIALRAQAVVATAGGSRVGPAGQGSSGSGDRGWKPSRPAGQGSGGGDRGWKPDRPTRKGWWASQG